MASLVVAIVAGMGIMLLAPLAQVKPDRGR